MSDDLIKALQKEAQEDAEIITFLRAANEKLNVALDVCRKEANKAADEITRLRAENERLREALIRIDGMATTICMKDDAGYGIRAESVMPIYETARAALECVTEPPTGDSNA